IKSTHLTSFPVLPYSVTVGDVHYVRRTANLADEAAMPLFGAHMSISGGFHKALERAAALGMETVQIFTASPNRWSVPPLVREGRPAFQSGQFLTKAPNQWSGRPVTAEDVPLFRKARRQTRIRFATAHDSYLINLASPDPALFRRSLAAFVEELA